MKIMFYALRPFDEQQYCDPYKARYGIDYTGTPDVPRPDNLHLAEGCDAVSTNPCEIRPEYLQTWAEMGVKYLPCRSIGYDHIPLDTAKKLGLRISHSHYPPDGVANYTIMLMLMCTRRMNEIMLRANVQDYSLPGKMGRDISGCTVGVIGTGKIGQTVIRHLSGFGCKILAYDLYPNDAVRQYADYVTLDELYAQSDIITLHTNATAENHHLINAGALAKMKDGVLLVNTARGTLIDPDALIAGLESGKIGGAGLDVIEDETGIYYYNRMGQAIPNRELNLLRWFRDNKLQSTPQGEAIVREYYRVGPLLVQAIDRTPDPDALYQSLWEDYIRPSCTALENRQWEPAKQIYVRMVKTLCLRFGVEVRPQICEALKDY